MDDTKDGVDDTKEGVNENGNDVDDNEVEVDVDSSNVNDDRGIEEEYDKNENEAVIDWIDDVKTVGWICNEYETDGICKTGEETIIFDNDNDDDDVDGKIVS